MTSSLLHPVQLKPIEPPAKAVSRTAQVAGLAALVIGVLILGVALG
jgi:hypothetical protein